MDPCGSSLIALASGIQCGHIWVKVHFFQLSHLSHHPSFVSLRVPAWAPPSQYQLLPQRLSLSRTLRPTPIMATMVTNIIYIYMRGISKVT